MHVDTHCVYVHAGVDPELPLNRQREVTLLWKRCPKGYSTGFGHLHLLHGHDDCPEGPLLFEGRTDPDTLAWLSVGVFDDERPGGPVDFMAVTAAPAGRQAAYWGSRFGVVGVWATDRGGMPGGINTGKSGCVEKVMMRIDCCSSGIHAAAPHLDGGDLAGTY